MQHQKTGNRPRLYGLHVQGSELHKRYPSSPPTFNAVLLLLLGSTFFRPSSLTSSTSFKSHPLYSRSPPWSRLFAMKFSSTLFLASLVPYALASAPFSIIAARSASPIHLQPVEASSQSFWIGKGTSSYCPTVVTPNCPPGTQTALLVSGNVGGCSMVRIFFLLS